jgi:putative transposase
MNGEGCPRTPHEYPPKVCVSLLGELLTSASSDVLRRRLRRIGKSYGNNARWSPCYLAATCGGAPLEGRKRNIEQQAERLSSWLTPA